MSVVLITGASGYIGSHLLPTFDPSHTQVRAFSRHYKAPIPPHVTWHQGDIGYPADLEAALADCEAVIHLVCLPLKASQEDPLEAFRVNTLGTWNLLQAMEKAQVRRLVFLSTAQVYGRPRRLPIREDHPPQPESVYASSKLCAEWLCAAFAQRYQADVAILRLFNVYGAPLGGVQVNTVETIFARRVLAGLPPIIKSHPHEGRDFIYITDVIRAIHLALSTVTGLQVLNIGSGVMTTLIDLAQLIIALGGASLTPIIEPQGDEKTTFNKRPMQLQADIRRAQKVLGFQPQVSLRQGLTELFEALSASNYAA